MRRNRRPVRIRWERLWGMIFAVLLLAGLAGGYREMRDLVAVYGESRCRNLVVNSTAEAVLSAKNAEKLICFTEHGNTSAFQLNSTAVRDIQQSVSVALAEKLENLGEQSHRVRLGTVLDSLFFMDRGPEIAFRFVPVGHIHVAVTSDLQAAGINQVLYRAVLDVQVEMTVLLPGGNRSILCQQRVPLEEVLVSGDVPLVYGGETVATG